MTLFDRRRFLLAAAGAAATACAGTARRGNLQRGEPCDLLLRGGRVFDGTGAPPFWADLAVRERRIVGIGDYAPRDARDTLDLDGLCVAPGFVDIHTHSDRSILRFPGAESRVRQGVTTEITGNCGSSAAPRGPDDASAPWTDVRSYAQTLQAANPAIHHAMLVGHGTLRSIVLGDVDRRATAAELDRMAELLDTALRQGAIGMSTGLEYVPGLYAPADEIERLARVVARHGGLYASHMRSEEEALLAAIDETLAVGRRTGVRVQVSHLKACGRSNWPLLAAAIERLEQARRDGVDVMADAYPYTAYSTTLTILLEPWSREGGAEAVVARLRDPDQRARMRAEVVPHVASDPGGFELVVIASVANDAHQACVGRNLVEIAAMWRIEPADAFLRLLEENGADVGFIGHGIAADGVDRVLAHPLVMVGSDGRTMAPVGRQLERPHPRSYGSFPRVLGLYCREQGLFDLPTAIAKMTAMPAARARLRDRGRIAVGAFADLVAFDAATVRDGATFASPQEYPLGIPHVVVDGSPVVRDGVDTGARPGRWLAHGG